MSWRNVRRNVVWDVDGQWEAVGGGYTVPLPPRRSFWRWLVEPAPPRKVRRREADLVARGLVQPEIVMRHARAQQNLSWWISRFAFCFFAAAGTLVVLGLLHARPTPANVGGLFGPWFVLAAFCLARCGIELVRANRLQAPAQAALVQFLRAKRAENLAAEKAGSALADGGPTVGGGTGAGAGGMSAEQSS